MQKHNLKILLTGGHAHATAYALVKEIKKVSPLAQIYWLGPKSLIEGKVVQGVEDKVFESLGVKVFNINAGRAQIKFTRHTLTSLFKIPWGFMQSVFYVARLNPDITVSFGGFVGLPVVIASKIFGIPIVIHEQTTVSGRGNRYAAKFADKVAISRESSRAYFPQNKTVLIGNPVDEEIVGIKRKSKIGSPPILFVTGGHTGSTALNNIILKVLPDLLKDFYVIHQTGEVDYKRCIDSKLKLGSGLSKKYEVYANIDPRIWPNVLSKADIIISRAGANTVSQIVALKIPSLLIPITHTYLDEQGKNADFAVEFGVSTKLSQHDLTSENIFPKIKYLKDNWQKIVSSTNAKISPDLQASKNFAKLIIDEAEK